MSHLERSLNSKRPATVTTYDARPVILMSAPYASKADLVAAIQRQARRGEIRPLRAQPVYNSGNGMWEIHVLRLREPTPAWVRPAAITAGILATLGALFMLGWWVLVTVSLVPLLAFLIAAAAVLAGIARAGRPTVVNISQNVRVR